MKNIVAKKPKKSVSPGDVWILGEHRIACGSSSDKELVKKLMGEGAVRQILTDPPYGVAYVENKEHFKNKTGESQVSNATIIQGDQLQTEEEYAEFTKTWIEAVVPYLSKYNTIYIFNSDTMICALRKGMKEAGVYYSQLIIWVKNTVVIGRKDYLPQHELIAYGWHGRHKMERSKAKSVILCPKPAKSKLHPTMKPVQLLRQLIGNSTKIGDTVYDPFGGSGSTLIACEHYRRKCLMIEIDPDHVATTLQRWEILTGKEAVKE
jgi:DNA modification methylase